MPMPSKTTTNRGDGGAGAGGVGVPRPVPRTRPKRQARRWTGATAYVARRIRGRGPPTPPAPAPPSPPRAALPRLRVRNVPRDDLVHGLARVPDPLFAHGELDDLNALVGRSA